MARDGRRRRRRWWAAPAVVLAAVAGVVGPASGAAGQTEDVCARFGEGASVGAVANPALIEISGVAASRRHEGVWWVHNDSGGAPEVSAVSPTGEDLGTYAITGAQAVDWEDIAVGPGPDPEGSYLYVADIGDNAAQREQVVVYRVAEPEDRPEARPDGGGDVLADPESFSLRYPDGPTDAEALLVDPLSGDLLVISKDPAGGARVFRAGRDDLVGGAELTLDQVATVPAAGVAGDPPPGLVTAADVSPDGSVVVVRYYGAVSAFLRPAGEALGAAFTDPACRAPQIAEQQGEAIAFSADGASYVTVSEGENPALNRFPVTPPLPSAQTDPEPTTPAADAGAPDDEADDGLGLGPVVAVAAVAVALAVGAVLLVARRRR